MKISVRRSGGFAGLTEQIAAIDTENLSADARQHVESAVREANFFALPEVIAGTTGADLYRYEVEVTNGALTHTVAYLDDGENAGNQPVQRLVRTILERANAS